MDEAREMGFPSRLPWMRIGSYSQPRVIKAFGCWNKAATVHRGILAGCARATTLLTMLTYKAINRVHQLCPNVTPRDLVDDSTFQWIGSWDHSTHELMLGSDSFVRDTAKLGLVLQVKKSGWVANTKHGQKGLSQTVRKE